MQERGRLIYNVAWVRCTYLGLGLIVVYGSPLGPCALPNCATSEFDHFQPLYPRPHPGGGGVAAHAQFPHPLDLSER